MPNTVYKIALEAQNNIEIKFVLQHQVGDEWIASIDNESLRPVVDFAIVVRNSSPATKQRIIRRVIETIDELFIDTI